MNAHVVITFDANTAKKYKEALEKAEPSFRKIKQKQVPS